MNRADRVGPADSSVGVRVGPRGNEKSGARATVIGRDPAQTVGSWRAESAEERRKRQSSGTQVGDRRVPGEGPHHRRVPRPGLRRRVLHRPHPRPPTERRGDAGEDQGQAVGPARGRRRQRLRALLRGAARQEGSTSPSSRRCSRTPTSSTSPPTRTARARRSPGTCSTSSSRRASRCTGWSSTRSPRRPSSPRSPTRAQINDDLVEAQEARRILDRLYGYEVSPVLWKKVMSGLSAGRVQSVATRLVVDKERDRMKFRVASYWDIEGTFDAGAEKDPRMFPGKLHSIDDQRVASGSDFGDDGQLKDKKGGRVHLDRAGAEGLVQALDDTTFEVRSVEAKPYRRQPYAPFRTTTMQQEASRKLGMSASVTMSVAQRLYENGFITYMRTDSTTLSSAAVDAARSQVRELYGAEYVPDQPRVYASKVKNAQEAHEAIRPSGESFRTPAQTGLTGEQFRLYELIWMRTVASQMKDAVGQSVSVRHRRRGVRRPRRGLLGVRPGDHLPRLPEGLRRGDRGRQALRRRPGAAARPARGRRGLRRGAQRARPRDQAAGPLHRGHADQGARGPRDRPARRRTPRSSGRSSTAATSTRRAPRWCRPGWRSR